jgi:REP element-mobilizing transposase RayT
VIFCDDLDRAAYVGHLVSIVEPTTTRVLAWALMDNHVHLVVETGSLPLSKLMQRLGTQYVRAFNDRHDRVGHLFQGRFKSILIEEDTHWLAVVRYVHLNPVRAGVVTNVWELADYPWTGHATLVGRQQASFQTVRRVLERFGQDPKVARQALVSWMMAKGADDPPIDGNTRDRTERASLPCPPASLVERDRGVHRDARIIGSPVQIQDAIASRSPSLASRIQLARSWPLDRLISHVCHELSASPSRLREGSRRAEESAARAAIAYLARCYLGMSFSALAPHLGVSAGALGRQVEHGRRAAKERGIHLE